MAAVHDATALSLQLRELEAHSRERMDADLAASLQIQLLTGMPLPPDDDDAAARAADAALRSTINEVAIARDAKVAIAIDEKLRADADRTACDRNLARSADAAEKHRERIVGLDRELAAQITAMGGREWAARGDEVEHPAANGPIRALLCDAIAAERAAEAGDDAAAAARACEEAAAAAAALSEEAAAAAEAAGAEAAAAAAAARAQALDDADSASAPRPGKRVVAADNARPPAGKRKRPEREAPKQSCVICCDEVRATECVSAAPPPGAASSAAGCGHWLCRGCMCEHLIMLGTERRPELRCVVPECDGYVPMAMAEELLGSGSEARRRDLGTIPAQYRHDLGASWHNIGAISVHLGQHLGAISAQCRGPRVSAPPSACIVYV